MVNTVDELKQLIEDDEENQYIAVRQAKTSTAYEHALVYDSEGFIELPDGTILQVIKPPPVPFDDIQKFYDNTIKPQECVVDIARCYADKNQDKARNISHAFNTNFDPNDRWSAAGIRIKVSAPFLNDEWYEIIGFYYLPFKSNVRSYNIVSFNTPHSTKELPYGWQYCEYPTPIKTNRWLAQFNGNTNKGKNWNSFPAIIPVGKKISKPECPLGKTWDIVSQQCILDTAENKAPISNAGVDQIVSTGQKVTLDGRGSSDPDGDVLKYIWTLVSGTTPAITEVFPIPNFEGAVIEYIAPKEPTEMLWELKVTDPLGLISTDTITVRVTKNPPTNINSVMTAHGDSSCNSEAKQTLKTVSMHKPDLVYNVGDLAYNDNTSICYYTISEQAGIFPIEKASLGNHECETAGSIAEVKAKYNMPSQQEIDGIMYPCNGFYRILKSDKKLYSICLNTNDDQMSRSDSDQFKFTVACLKEAQRLRELGTIKWIVIWMHHPMYSQSSKHAPERDIRALYHPIFDQYDVDVVIFGHNHNTQVTYPIRYGGAQDANPIIVDRRTTTGAFDFSQLNHGQIYIVCGAGGRDLYGFNGSTPIWLQYGNDNEFQIIVMVMTHDFSKLTIIAQPNNDITINKFSTVLEKGEIQQQPLQSNAGDDQTAVGVNQTITLDGRKTTGFPTTWKWEIVANEGNHPINLIEPNSMRCSFLVPESFKTVKNDVVISLTVISQEGTSVDTMTVFNRVEETPTGQYPIPVVELYNSDQTLAQDITIPKSQTHPNDKVLLSSGASGVSSHSIKNGWLEIQTGGGNGRCYWNHHEIHNSESLRKNMFIALQFKLPAGFENLSIKDGNHGTGGWVFDGKFIFGGFGFSLHRTEIQSKLEWYHNVQGKEVSSSYPGGRNINTTDVYRLFATFRTDANRKDVVLDVWILFPNESSWTQVMTNRRWGSSGDYNVPSLPNGDDTEFIKQGANMIPRYHCWTRANSGGGSQKLPVRNIRFGSVSPIS